MLFSRTIMPNSSKTIVYVITLAFGIIILHFGINRYDYIWTSEGIFPEFKTFSIEDYVSRLYNITRTTSIQRNLIITAAINMELVSVYRFARSVRATCYSSTLVMIMTKTAMSNRDFQELADVYSIIYISDEDYFPAKLKVERPDTAPIYTSCWIIIKNFLFNLQMKGVIFDNIFACDSLDTVFQRDVFAFMMNYTPGLYVFMEDIRMTIGTCRFNSGWIKGCYGDAELKRLYSKPISCSGTVLGTWSAMISYLSVMESEIIATPAACKDRGIDQGFHNYIIYNNKIPNITIHRISHEYGFVGTLGYAKRVLRNPFGLVFNANGSIYAVIHQWNRSKQMVIQFKREYQLIAANIRNNKN